MSNKHFYTNGIIDRKFSDDEIIPEGWYRGRTNCGKSTKGYIWINDGVNRKFILETSEIPEGWKKGNIKFTDEHKQNLSKSLKGKKRTEEQRKRISESHKTEEYKTKINESRFQKYGVENFFQDKSIHDKAIEKAKSKESREKARQTNNNKLGVDYPTQSEKVRQKVKQSMINNYGVDNNFKRPEIREQAIKASHSNEANHKRKLTNIDRYGYENPAQSELVKDKMRNTNIARRGVPYPVSNEEVFNKQIQTNMERYGVKYNIQLPQSMIGSRDSMPNKAFADLLDKNNIQYSREFSLGKYIYDFKIENILIEINPTVTHNSLWNPFGNHDGIDKNYHINKSNNAKEHGYRVIHVFDWDDKQQIINLLKYKSCIYGRNTIIKEVSKKDADLFLKQHHLQGSCRNQSIRIGLYYNDELISIMTFGKPRYNKNYQYELLRYCSSKMVIGGANKLFKYFIKNYNPINIISYCDLSKFSGNVYNKLGFTLKTCSSPNKHWYKSNSKIPQITNNMLLQMGFDKIFKTNYGRGTSNEDLIINEGYLPVYDCGQATFIYE